MSKHTNKEQETIRTAWHILMTACERSGYYGDTYLEKALKTGKKQYSDIHAARGVILKAVVKGFDNVQGDIADLLHYDDATRIAFIVGAWLQKNYPKVVADVRERLEEAVEVHVIALNRHLATL